MTEKEHKVNIYQLQTAYTRFPLWSLGALVTVWLDPCWSVTCRSYYHSHFINKYYVRVPMYVQAGHTYVQFGQTYVQVGLMYVRSNNASTVRSLQKED